MKDVNVASVILEHLQDDFELHTAKLAEVSSYSDLFNVGRGLVRKQVVSYVYDVEGESLRVDVLDGKIYRPGCGGSVRHLTFVAKRVTLS